MKRDTRLLRSKAPDADPLRASAPPLYQTSTFADPEATAEGPYDYTRSGNPTRKALEALLATLECDAGDAAVQAFAFSTGMAALTVAAKLVPPGKRIVAGTDLYGGAHRLLSQIVAPAGVEVVYTDTTDTEKVAEAIDNNTSLVLLESPTNPMLRIADIRAISKLAHAKGARVCVDNSALSPYLQRPLELGADISMHSATKHLAGHSDTMAGALIVRDAELAECIGFFQNAEGAGLSPFDCWLTLRGAKTLAVRLDRQQQTAQKLAEFLASRKEIKAVHYPGLPGHPGKAIHDAQADGPGALLSFETGDAERSQRLVRAADLFRITVSFGSVHSLISLPNAMSHAAIPEKIRRHNALPADIVRISAGLENADDLIESLSRAIAAMG